MPFPTKETVDPLTVQTVVVALVKVTAFPEPPPVAATDYEPPYVGVVAVYVKVIACGWRVYVKAKGPTAVPDGDMT